MAFVLALFSPMATWALEKTLTNSLGMEFVLIPAGTFTMGSPTDELGRNRDEVTHSAKNWPVFLYENHRSDSQTMARYHGKTLFLAERKDQRTCRW